MRSRNSRRPPLAIAALAAAAVAAPIPAAAAATVVSAQPALQDERAGGAETLVVRSDALNRDVTVEVTRPEGPPVEGRKPAAVYVLDRGFMAIGPAARLLARAGVAAPAYVVAVSSQDPGADRNRDLVHRRLGEGSGAWGGGGEAFETFLVHELRPLIEARYGADPDRAILFGHSLGGLFAATILVERPREFSGYLLASPSIWATPDLVQKARALSLGQSGPRVFIGYGDDEPPETIGHIHQFAEALARPQTGVQAREQAFEGQNHLSSFLMEGPAGLPFLLPAGDGASR